MNTAFTARVYPDTPKIPTLLGREKKRRRRKVARLNTKVYNQKMEKNQIYRFRSDQNGQIFVIHIHEAYEGREKEASCPSNFIWRWQDNFNTNQVPYVYQPPFCEVRGKGKIRRGD
jgi:hypothetical protein